jgi:selenocysteine lyase/cysteine desulfurase
MAIPTAIPEEVAIVRNATEALNAVLLGVPLRGGDEVLTTTLDYWAMQDALQQRAERDGVVVKRLKIPVPCGDLSEIVRRFEQQMGERTKLILISHPINLNGQLFPVREICRLAHAHGAEVVVDAAQSFALVDYKLQDLECDYLGTSLHQWLQAPKGTGMLYVKRDKIQKVGRCSQLEVLRRCGRCSQLEVPVLKRTSASSSSMEPGRKPSSRSATQWTSITAWEVKKKRLVSGM